MKEVLVNFETSLLAKQKGFDWKCLNWYGEEKNFENELFNLQAWTWNTNKGNRNDFQCTAPTQSFLQKWIRDTHGIDIVIFPMMTLVSKQKCHYAVLFDKACEEIGDWQNDYNDILEKASQDILGNYLNNELHDKFLFESNFACIYYEEALGHALNKALNLINKE